MLDWIATHADTILAATQAILTGVLVPLVWTQWRERRSTVPLLTSVVTFAGLGTIALVYASSSWWFAVAVVLAAATCWAIIVAQRVVYGGTKED